MYNTKPLNVVINRGIKGGSMQRVQMQTLLIKNMKYP